MKSAQVNGCTEEVKRIKQIVSEHFDLKPGEMDRRTRQLHIAWPRQVAMWLCVEHLPSISFLRIGQLFGKPKCFNHASVHYACLCVNESRECEPAVPAMLAELERRISGIKP